MNRKPLLSFFIGLLGLLSLASGATAEVVHRWTQLGPGSDVIVRAITRGSACPEVQADGRSVAMTQRAAPTARFPGRVCETTLRRSSRQVTLDDRALPTLAPAAQRIAVIGDTGCRIKGKWAQACNDPAAWPFGAIAKAIVKQQPDLVIHVGDYWYREAPCPASADCQGSPYGHNGSAWAADWFDPAQPLLSQAPFLFLRGNHERCGRASEGWYRYLAVGPAPAGCDDVTAPWKTRVNGVDMIAFDSSAGPPSHSAPDNLETYRRQAKEMFAGLQGEAWLLTHRPLWAYLRAFGTLITGDGTQRAAFGGTIPGNVHAVLSGHLHAFQALDMELGPVQLIAGNSGTRLDPMPTEVRRDVDIGGRQAATILSDAGFGFILLRRTGEGRWHMEAHGADGAVRRRCVLSAGGLSCDGVR